MPAQQALETSLKEVLQALSFDLAQELRVTNFRLAQFIEKKMKERFKDDVRDLKELNPSFAFLAYEGTEPQLMEFTGPFSDITPYTSVKSHFKNVKAFFEKNEKEQLRDALEQLTKPDAQKFLDVEKAKLVEWAAGYLSIEAENLRQHMLEQALEQIETERLLLQEESRLAIWKDIYEQLRS